MSKEFLEVTEELVKLSKEAHNNMRRIRAMYEGDHQVPRFHHRDVRRDQWAACGDAMADIQRVTEMLEAERSFAQRTSEWTKEKPKAKTKK